MHFALDTKSSPGISEIKSSGTPSYVELEMPLDETGESLYIYLCPKSESSLYVAACLDGMFDFVNQASEYDINEFGKACPTIYRMIIDGMNDNYANCAIIRLNDPDDNGVKWYVSSVCGNIDFDSDWASSPKMGQCINKTVNALGEVLGEAMKFKESSNSFSGQLWRVGSSIAGTVATAALAALLQS
jgi:hypothetical protein